MGKRAKTEIEAEGKKAEKLWVSSRLEWEPLFLSIGKAMGEMDQWAYSVMLEAMSDPTANIMQKASSISISDSGTLEMLSGYRQSAMQEIMKSASDEYMHIVGKSIPSAAKELALGYVYQSGAEMVGGISANTRTQIQRLVARGVTDGKGIPSIARGIRRSIGLSDRDAKALENYVKRLKEKDLPASKIKSLTAKYKESKIRSRAETIARTEYRKARNIGQDMAWEMAIAEGEIPKSAQREWIAADPCPICAQFDGEVAKVGEPFRAGGYTFVRPPAHPNCRCGMALKV